MLFAGFFSALANWSGHDVPFPRQSMPSSRAITSRTCMPRTSAAMPCVFPWQPPVKATLRIVSWSISMSICREQVPEQMCVIFRVIRSCVFGLFFPEPSGPVSRGRSRAVSYSAFGARKRAATSCCGSVRCGFRLRGYWRCRSVLSATTMFLSMRSVTFPSTSMSSVVSFTSLTVP